MWSGFADQSNPMTLINIRDLGVTLTTPLFSKLDLSISAGDRIGLVAANGRGKSTLLRAIAGEIDTTEGQITSARGVTIGHVTQHIPPALAQVSFHDTVSGGLPAEQVSMESWRVDMLLDVLEVSADIRERKLCALSGGWQRLALLARTWISEPDVLLLDEPTNHLDLERIAVLENWLAGLPRETAIIIASHDRAFLDATTRSTLFLRPERSPSFALPYSKARVALDEVDAFEERQFQRNMKVAQQLRQQAAKLKNIGVNSGSDLLVVKTKQLKERAEKLEDASKPAHRERSSGNIALTNRGTHAKVLLSLEDAEVTTPDGTLLFKTGKQSIRQGDRIVLMGRNGVGKSCLMTMLRTAIENPVATSGIRATPSLVLGYADQVLNVLAPDETPLAAITRRFDISDQQAHTLLAGAGISITMHQRATSLLSGGQKARLGMLVLRLTNPNFYLLDEPTNHLDIDGQETLGEELTTKNASCVLVSHDRSFIREVANRFWLIEKRKLIEVDDPEGFFASFG